MKETSLPRELGGAISAIYIGARISDAPTPIPPSILKNKKAKKTFFDLKYCIVRDEFANESKKFKRLIIDDGLQDKSINYDLKIVCFNKKNFIGNGRLIPAGPLREKLNSLKKKCYSIVIKNFLVKI